jgi:SAM-dependent methyltransferase
MRMMTISKKLGKAFVGLNVAIVVRALRFGISDAKERLAQTFHDIDPFANKNGQGLPVSGESPRDDMDDDPPFNDADWDETVALSRQEVGPLSYNKVCNVEDFRHPDLLPWIREIYAHEIRRFGPKFPMGFEDRRHWEVAMTVRTLFDHGVLHDRSEVLGVGAGNEPTIFYLTRRVNRVFATDLYLPDGFGWAEADASMLKDPGLNWPFAWNPRRLVAQHMDGRELRYEDESFDGVFSTGSIEHFGTLDQIEQSMREIHRVLKPGGILAITTEFRVEGPDNGSPGLIFFSPELIEERLIGNLPWRLLSPYDYRLSDLTRQSEVLQSKAVEKFTEHIAKHKRLLYHKYRQISYPIILMKDSPYTFTSVSLSLQKV